MKALFIGTARCYAKIFSILTLSASLFPLVANAGPPECKGPVTERPIEDFLGAQGSTALFFPPVHDMVAHTGGPPASGEIIDFAVVDYAGLADACLADEGCLNDESLGTDPRGQVKQRDCDDGSVEITVKLFTRNALGFAQSIQDLIDNDFDFLDTPTIFGARAQDIADGAEPALGSSTLDVTFRIYCGGFCDEPVLPDLRKVVQCPNGDPEDVFCGSDDYRPVRFSFHSTTFEKKGAYENNRVLHVQQVGFAPQVGDDINEVFDYEKEVVNIVP